MRGILAPSPLTLKSSLNQIEDWKELTGFVAMSVASVRGAFVSNRVMRPVSWGIAVISVAVAAWCRESPCYAVNSGPSRKGCGTSARINPAQRFASWLPLTNKMTCPAKTASSRLAQSPPGSSATTSIWGLFAVTPVQEKLH